MLQLIGLLRWIGIEKLWAAGAVAFLVIGFDTHQLWLIEAGIEGLGWLAAGALLDVLLGSV